MIFKLHTIGAQAKFIFYCNFSEPTRFDRQSVPPPDFLLRVCVATEEALPEAADLFIPNRLLTEAKNRGAEIKHTMEIEIIWSRHDNNAFRVTRLPPHLPHGLLYIRIVNLFSLCQKCFRLLDLIVILLSTYIDLKFSPPKKDTSKFGDVEVFTSLQVRTYVLRVTMLFFIGWAVVAAIVAYTFACYRSLMKNLAAAKASNVPYIIVPVYFFQPVWLLGHQAAMPYLRKLPKKWTNPWLEVMTPEWSYEHLYSTYKELGSDTFITVSPGGNMIWCADANAISQITTRRNDFPKPIDLYGSIDLFGKNVVTTEGQNWRHHRKITSPPFTEKNNHTVWAESIHQAKSMVTSWTGLSGNEIRTIDQVPIDTMRLSLHVISRAGFGVRLLWPGVEDELEQKEGEAQVPGKDDVSSIGLSAGHTMTYTEALGTLLHQILWVMLTPHFLLKRLPMKRTRLAWRSYVEWGKYMNEMFQAKKAEVAAGKAQEGLDLMGALVRGAGITTESLNAQSVEKGKEPPKQALTDDEIIGNAFVFILAGHETAANSIHFSCLFLALNIRSQRNLQKDLQSIFQDKPTSEWDYERDLPKLFSGMAGAVLNEELRLIPPVINIPKSTPPDKAQPIVLEGKDCLMPANTLLNLSCIAVHRNPKFWPTGPPSDPANPAHPTSNLDNDLEEFKPERWLTAAPKSGSNSHTSTDAHKLETEDLGINTASDTSTQFRPPKGAYIPFSEGYRACLGRRFAQVEVLAVLAVIFTQYSVELAVDEWASDEEVEKMDVGEKRKVWEKARDRARKLIIGGMGTIITLQMRAGVVPLRFVKKGTERFNFD